MLNAIQAIRRNNFVEKEKITIALHDIHFILILFILFTLSEVNGLIIFSSRIEANATIKCEPNE